MILFFSDIQSPRLTYILNHIFNTLLSIDYEWMSDIEKFKNAENSIKINYTENPISGSIHLIQKSSIFWEESLNENSYQKALHHPEDTLALAFLALSRYEEYLEYKADEYGRFPFSESRFFQQNNIEIPYVDALAFELKEKIQNLQPNFRFPDKNIKSICSIDIDRVWKYKTTPKWKLFLKYFKYLLTQDKANLSSIKHFFKTQTDPFDTFEYIQNHCQKHQVWLQYFALLSPIRSPWDNNINVQNTQQQLFFKNMSSQYPLGIHPSLHSQNNTQKIKKEKETLEQITQNKVGQSRQHYIQLKFPQTYQSLIKSGITEDYSMGFPERCGFRAGTSHPFQWFDLSKNQVTSLTIIPFAVMDVSMRKYMKLSPKEAIAYIAKIRKTIQKYNGTFVSIFHNQNLQDQGVWKGWKEVFESSVKPLNNDTEN